MWKKEKSDVRQMRGVSQKGLRCGLPGKAGSIVLAVALALTSLMGCSGGAKNTQSSADAEETSVSQGASGGVGRFVEEELSLPDGYSRPEVVRVLEDGSIGVIAETEQTCALLTSQDLGETWEEEKLNGVEADIIQAFALAPDGRAAFCEYSEGASVPLKYWDAEGNLQQLSLDLDAGDGYNGIWQMQFDDNGELFAMDYNGELLNINLTDGSCTQPFDMRGVQASYFSIAGTTLLAVQTEGVYLFDTETGESLEDEAVLNDLIASDKELQYVSSDSGFPLIFAGGSQEDRILLAYSDGIFHFTLGGSVKEQLVDGNLSSLSSLTALFTSMAYVDEDHLLVTISDSEKKLLRFTYDENVSSMPEKELTVYSLYDSTALRLGINVFQKVYPDVYVNLQIGLSDEDSGVTLEDSLKALSTEILAGNGPDVLILDDMPVQSYIEKGVLTDISDLVEEVRSEDGLFDNIVDGSREEDGSIYAVPLRFLAEFVQGDAQTVAAAGSLSSLTDRAEELKGAEGYKGVLPPRGKENLLYELFEADSADWITQDGELDMDKLEAYYTQAKRLYDMDSGQGDEVYSSVYTYGSYEVINGTLTTLGTLSKTNILEFGSLASLDDLQLALSVMEKTGDTYGLFNNEETPSYIPYLQVGINASGDVENARALVKTLLGKEAGADANGFPVNRAAYETLAQKKLEESQELSLGVSLAGSDAEGEMLSVEYIQLTQEQIDTCTAMLESLKTPVLTDGVIRELVLKQGEAYLSGEQSLEETLDQVQKKVSLYLSE